MEVQVDFYNRINEGQKNDAKRLIQKMIDLNHEWNLVVDIGSGTGNITKFLLESVPINRIVGIDIDSKMVEFSKQHYADSRIDYLVGDASLPWNQLPDQVKQLKGKSSAVFSNQVLHWIREKHHTAENMFHLLLPGGKAFISIATFDKICPSDISEEEKAEVERLIPLTDKDKQVGDWKEALANAGFAIVGEEQYLANDVHTQTTVDVVGLKMMKGIYMNFAVGDDPKSVIDRYEDVLVRGYLENWAERLNDVGPDGKNMIRVSYGRAIILAEKPTKGKII